MEIYSRQCYLIEVLLASGHILAVTRNCSGMYCCQLCKGQYQYLPKNCLLDTPKPSRDFVYFVRFLFNKCRSPVTLCTFCIQVLILLHTTSLPSPASDGLRVWPSQLVRGKADHCSFTFICPYLYSRWWDSESSWPCLVLKTSFILVYVVYLCETSATPTQKCFP